MTTPFVKALACNSITGNSPRSCGATLTLDHKNPFEIKTVSCSCNLGSASNSLYEVYLATESGKVGGAVFLTPQSYVTLPP